MKRTLLAALLALGACTPSVRTAAPASACAAPLEPAVEVDLYFGLSIEKDRQVSEAEWAAFLNEEVTRRFPDGLSVLDVRGQYRMPDGRIERERSKLLVVVVFDAPAHTAKVQAVIDAYKKRYGQHSVFRVEKAVCAGA
ncbi:MAG: DUF3574 domain-containing protein [Proteobacteria bacterium]|nr:DUF3574 domain-containing protein [Pseudomonadota bacterium]